jgi:hypothetical protein
MSHGDYITCLTTALQTLVADGVISDTMLATLISERADVRQCV